MEVGEVRMKVLTGGNVWYQGAVTHTFGCKQVSSFFSSIPASVNPPRLLLVLRLYISSPIFSSLKLKPPLIYSNVLQQTKIFFFLSCLKVSTVSKSFKYSNLESIPYTSPNKMPPHLIFVKGGCGRISFSAHLRRVSQSDWTSLQLPAASFSPFP